MKSALAFLALFAVASAQQGNDLLSCLLEGPPGCLAQHLERILSRANLIPQLRITRDLSIVRLPSQVTVSGGDEEEDGGEVAGLWTRLESYLFGHGLRLEMPRELQEQGVLPRSILEALPRTITVPLAHEGKGVEGRGFLRKIVLPFLLGLKFKAVVVIPLAMALIALKTWKALTLGLLSAVLSAAMVMFQMSRPKVLNYELYYPPPPPPPTAHHHLFADHSGPAVGAFAAYDHHHHQARALPTPDNLAYSAHVPEVTQ